MILGYSPTSVCYRVTLLNSSGAGLTGLTYDSVGLVISAIKASASAVVSYSAVANTIEAVGTAGSYVAPTTNKVRFGEVEPITQPGLYEIQFDNTVWASTTSVEISVLGATSLVEFHEKVQTLNIPSNVMSINSDTTSASNLSTSAKTMIVGTVDAFAYTPTTTQFDTSLTDATTGTYIGRVLIFSSGSLIRQARTINAYQLVDGRGRFVLDPFTSPALDEDEFIVL
jgi:hypothetical protein